MTIAENIKHLQENIADILSRLNRKDEITLVAVSIISTG